MKPRGLLMIEHRLIEKLFVHVAREVERIEQSGDADPLFIETVVDFIRTYADRTHHGKEEEILFKILENKPLDKGDRADMHELVEEHRLARRTVKELVEATARYRTGVREARSAITERLRWLAEFYPKHIAKEDKAFFPRTERYFAPRELERLLQEFYEFDRAMIHEKYRAVVESLP